MKRLLVFFSCSLLFLGGCGNTVPISDEYNPNPEPSRPQPKIVEFPYSESKSDTKTPISSSSPIIPLMNTEKPNTLTSIATLHTSKGDIEITLNNTQTPKTVENFLTLAKKNFYDNTIFHRVLKGFMIQGGDPDGDGTGGPGYRFDDEPFTGEYTRGTVAMANAGPNTNGSQFFIMHADYPLPKNYVIFGDVIGGIDTVDKIAEAPTSQNGMGENSKPVNPVKIESVTINEQ